VNELLQYAAFGIGISAVYAMLGQGIVVIYRGSGVVNFAQGTLDMLCVLLL